MPTYVKNAAITFIALVAWNILGFKSTKKLISAISEPKKTR